MRNVRFNDDAVKEFRRLARDYGHRGAFIAALKKVYQTGYDNALKENKHDGDQSANASFDNDGERV